ncbi:uncharacterized protein LOC123553535 [Mercenaria mercenaria]|uniref:uncharacterized protein LOC123553535 n=1 Tax=Mercenaria mercenaria TaxID=6596 RepID=UPI00234F3A47|nr:uncharacterized protein LOC123553535 [Mercenaria mercenaria]
MYMDVSMEHMRPDKADRPVEAAQYASQSQQRQPFIPTNMFLHGYKDCAQEALWYLTEVEKLPPDHSTVVGLKEHLYEEYRLFRMQHMLRNALQMCNEEDMYKALPGTKLNQERENDVDTFDVILNGAKESVTKCAIQSESVPKCEKNVQECSFTANTDSVQKNNKGISSNFEEQSVKSPMFEDQENDSETELSPEAYKVAVALAEEIYSLLQGQDDVIEEQGDLDYWSDTDIENESADEGFEEMIEP